MKPGTFKHTEEAKEKIRKAMTGRNVSEKTKQKLKQAYLTKDKSYMTEEWKKKISETLKKRYSNGLIAGFKKGNKAHLLKKQISKPKKEIVIKTIKRGMESHAWKGGVCSSNEIDRKRKEYKEWRKAVFNRDGYQCQICLDVGGNLNAHHIKSFSKHKELRYEVANGVTLCTTCHKGTHVYERLPPVDINNSWVKFL